LGQIYKDWDPNWSSIYPYVEYDKDNQGSQVRELWIEAEYLSPKRADSLSARNGCSV